MIRCSTGVRTVEFGERESIMSLLRTRWAALGAAVAVTLGGGGVGLVSATRPAAATTFVPIVPCRVVDTRPQPEFNTGPRSAPLVANENFDIAAVGNAGDCAAVPADAAAVSLNVTAIDAELPTFLTVYPTGAPLPDASNLNPLPGAPPTPNAVITKLSDDGRFTIYNLQGAVHVIIDINGYFVDHQHDDRYYTKSQIDARLPIAAAVPSSGRCSVDQTGDGEAKEGQYLACTDALALGRPDEHAVLLVAQIGWAQFDEEGVPVKGSCQLERDGVVVPGSTITMGEKTVRTTQENIDAGVDDRRLNWAGVTAVSGPHTGAAEYRVACREIVGDIEFNDITLSGITAAP